MLYQNFLIADLTYKHKFKCDKIIINNEAFGIIGTSFGIIAWSLIAKLRKEFEDLKKNLEDSGVLKEKSESGKN